MSYKTIVVPIDDDVWISDAFGYDWEGFSLEIKDPKYQPNDKFDYALNWVYQNEYDRIIHEEDGG